jgi:biopolymer transport protein ExbB
MFLLSPLLWQVDSAVQAATGAPAPATDSLSLWYLLREGGVLMIPLLLCSLVLVYVFAERWMMLRKATKYDPYFMLRIREHLSDGNLAGAKSLAKTTAGPVARIIEKGLNRMGRPSEQIEKAMEAAGRQEVYQMERNVGVLSSISRIAPIFGFLGTIAGMIVLFYNIQHQGFSLDAIAGGIYTKMVTSAVGLIIGLLAFLAYDYLNTQINKVTFRMEAAAADLQDAMLEVPAAKTMVG